MEMVGNLVAALELATLMAKQLPNTTDPPQTIQIYSALHAAHYHLSYFLSQTALPPPPPPQPSLQPPPAHNSLDDDTSPMVVGDEDEVEAEHNSMRTNTAVDGVEERMREFFIQNKRPKRSLSPSAVVAGEKRREDKEGEFVRDRNQYQYEVEFDPNGTRSKALELIYQFHS